MSCHRQPPAKVDVLSQYMAKVHHPIIDASEVNRPTRTENSAHSSSISSSKAECKSVSHIMRQWKYHSKLFPHCLCLGFVWECQGHNDWHGNARESKNAAKCFVFFLNAVICRSYRQTWDFKTGVISRFVLWANCPVSLPLCPIPFYSKFSSFTNLICASTGVGPTEC